MTPDEAIAVLLHLLEDETLDARVRLAACQAILDRVEVTP